MNIKAFALVAAWAFICGLVVVFVAYVMPACTPMPSKTQEADVASYEAEQLACVASYATRAEIDICRELVKAHHGRLDAGHYE